MIAKYDGDQPFADKSKAWAASALGALAFTLSNDDPEFTRMFSVTVSAGQLRLDKPDLRSTGTTFDPPTVYVQEGERRELEPLVGQLAETAARAYRLFEHSNQGVPPASISKRNLIPQVAEGPL